MLARGKVVRKFGFALLAIFFYSQFAIAAATASKISAVELIDMAGKQRVLSQMIAKDYLYKGADVAVNKSSKQLAKTLKESLYIQQKLKESISDPRIVNLISFVEMNFQDISAKTKEKFNTDNAQYVLDLSESMLEGNEYIMTSLQKSSGAKTSKLIDMSARQAMLSQRIAKYYIAYQLGIKDDNTIKQMNKAVEAFSKAHKLLMSNKTNTPELNAKLKKIDRLWSVVYKFYLDIEMGGLPLIVYNTTDEITKNMNEITSLYVKLK
ncbi:Nitric oxide-responding transcriptional regulator Dnr (Crp/Fnr family) [hydrothermal vent metagenome]|uniref:Nitric oxide-responding transcriptional regulator Dnr (Crp/Fnr family) n=1 Tax=hydrothermal vent metagenome TaxID=652676 RepID=A0A1W1BMF9_9ZZZZ